MADPTLTETPAANPAPAEKPFWQTKRLDQMTDAEWESLCDGCAKCCLHKLEDRDTGRILQTNVACRLLNLTSCRCSRYAERARFVPDCVKVTPDNAGALRWMPRTCAYRLLAEGRDLPDWHPLLTGDPDSVHRAGQSVRGRAITEFDADDLEDHVVHWADV